jgi:hypothetical protein
MTSAAFHIAQFNLARLLAPLDSPQLAEFVGSLERINALADDSPGFVWRLQGDGGDATSLRPIGEDVIVNMSLWESVEALFDFVYRSAHAPVMAKRRQWFANPAEVFMVLWWVKAGYIPTIDDAAARLEILKRKDPGPAAFTFKTRFPPPANFR